MPTIAERMVFVHGWAFGPEVWRPVLPSFVDFHPVRWNLPGYQHADSQPIPKNAFAINDAHPWIGIGWSLGGQHLLRLAARAPQRFRALVLIATNAQFANTEQWSYGVASEEIKEWENRIAANATTALRRFVRLCVHGAENADPTSTLLEDCLQQQTPPSQATLQTGLQSLATSNSMAELRKLKTRTLLIGGATDRLVPATALRAMKETNPLVEVEIIAGAGHAPFLSHPEILRQRILDFLA
jgi:pimeloyl-[acyl-carrier protein] methyl ester esterase